MRRAVSIHIGLNRVDTLHYRDAHGNGWDGYLSSCENDAELMRAVAIQAGFTPQLLLSAQATRAAVVGMIADQSSTLRADDILLISYAGYGGKLPGQNCDEIDRREQTWCLYDGQLLDSELHGLWRRLSPGVRVIVVSDSCHGATITGRSFNDSDSGVAPLVGDGDRFSRAMPQDVATATYRGNRQFYDRLLRNDGRAPLGCGILALAACKDDQVSSGDRDNGFFTMALNAAWANGATPGDYGRFIARIDKLVRDDVRATQTAQLKVAGNCRPDFIGGDIFAR